MWLGKDMGEDCGVVFLVVWGCVVWGDACSGVGGNVEERHTPQRYS